MLTVIATALLLLHQFMAVAVVAQRIRDSGASLPDVAPIGRQLFGDALGALALLLATTAISIYKPWGRIGVETRPSPPPSDRMKQAATRMPTNIRIVLLSLAALLITVLLIHIAGGWLHHFHG